MNLERVVTQMQRAGFALQITGDEKLLISPFDNLTEQQRDLLKANKRDLIKTLAQHGTPKLTDDDRQNIQEHLEERAATHEFDAGLSRPEAEKQARLNMRVFHYRIADNPDSWLVMIAPGCDLTVATRSLKSRFRERLIAVRERTGGLGVGLLRSGAK